MNSLPDGLDILREAYWNTFGRDAVSGVCNLTERFYMYANKNTLRAVCVYKCMRGRRNAGCSWMASLLTEANQMDEVGKKKKIDGRR